MEMKEIIAAVEKAMDTRFNEQTIKAIVSEELKKQLEPISKHQVIIGDLPDDQMRAPKVTFSQFLGDVARMSAGGNHPKLEGAGLRWLKPEQLVKVAGTGINPAQLSGVAKDLYATTTHGGYLVPTEESRTLIDISTEQFSVVPGRCIQVPMRTNQISFPTLTSGLTAYWIPEAGSTTTLGVTVDGTHQATGEKIRSDFAVGQMAINAYVCAVLVVVGNQLLDDSDPSVDAVLRTLFARTLGGAWDTASLLGAGTALDPITGLNSRCTTNALQAGAIFDFDDIVDLIFGCIDNDTVSNPVIVGNTKAEKVLMKVKDQNGQYVYKQPTEKAGVPSIWGQDYLRDGNILNTYGTSSNKTRLFAGDFGRHGYAGNRMGITIRTNPYGEPYFSFNQTAFLAEVRVGFNVDDEANFSKLDGVPTT